MRAVIQRCLQASVTVDGEVISSIQKGFMVLVGIGVDDTPQDSAFLVRKLLSIRLFDAPPPPSPIGGGAGESEAPADTGKGAWKSSVMDIGGEILCVSQFTLLARTEKGSKPDFHQAMSTLPGKAFYETFLSELGKAYDPAKIQDGRFGAMMQVGLVNDGPVTIVLDSKNPKGSSQPTPTPSGTTTPTTSKPLKVGKVSIAGGEALSADELEAKRLEKERKFAQRKEKQEMWRREQEGKGKSGGGESDTV